MVRLIAFILIEELIKSGIPVLGARGSKPVNCHVSDLDYVCEIYASVFIGISYVDYSVVVIAITVCAWKRDPIVVGGSDGFLIGYCHG